MNISDAEKIFGLKKGYTLEEVRAVRKKLALRYHPDKNDNSPDATFFMQQVNEAFEILQKAAQYNQSDTQKKKAEQPKQSSSEENNNKWQQQNGYWAQQDDGERKESAREEQERRRTAQQKREQDKKEHDYLKACEQAQKAKSYLDHKQVAKLFEALGDYKDSDAFCQFHKAKADEIQTTIDKERKFHLAYFIFSTVPIVAMAVLSFREWAFAGLFFLGLCIFPLIMLYASPMREPLLLALSAIGLIMAVYFAQKICSFSSNVTIAFSASLAASYIGCQIKPAGKTSIYIKNGLGIVAFVFACAAIYMYFAA